MPPIAELSDKWRPLAAAAVDLFEAGVRATTDLERSIAATVSVEPLHTLLTASADCTRDIGAVVASRSRWLLDV